MEAQQTQMILQAINSFRDGISLDIKALKDDVERDIKGLGLKLDSVVAGHHDLRVIVAEKTSEMATRIKVIDDNTSDLWDELRHTQQEQAAIKSNLTTHCAESAGAGKKKNELGTVARWAITSAITVAVFIAGRLL